MVTARHDFKIFLRNQMLTLHAGLKACGNLRSVPWIHAEWMRYTKLLCVYMSVSLGDMVSSLFLFKASGWGMVPPLFTTVSGQNSLGGMLLFYSTNGSAPKRGSCTFGAEFTMSSSNCHRHLQAAGISLPSSQDYQRKHVRNICNKNEAVRLLSHLYTIT